MHGLGLSQHTKAHSAQALCGGAGSFYVMVFAANTLALLCFLQMKICSDEKCICKKQTSAATARSKNPRQKTCLKLLKHKVIL